MNEEEFAEQLEIASNLVSTWPVWKQNVLQLYSSPTVAEARLPVDNNRLAEE